MSSPVCRSNTSSHANTAEATIFPLALSGDRCNLYKGTNLPAIDPDTGNVVLLFNPRSDVWREHFKLESGWVLGRTDKGRATARLLNMNAPRRVQLRLELGHLARPDVS